MNLHLGIRLVPILTPYLLVKCRSVEICMIDSSDINQTGQFVLVDSGAKSLQSCEVLSG